MLKKKGCDWSRIHSDEGDGPFRSFLRLLSMLYGVGVRMRVWAYRRQYLNGRRLPVFVASIGNITSGGTGKTPTVQMLAKWALAQGYQPAVLSRGYGGSFKERVLEVSNGKTVMTSPEKSGDEPYLLATTLKGVPVIVSRNRYNGGLRAIEKFSSNFLILDDGFQHLELQRDINILLLDASKPFGNGYLLPRGPLREPQEELHRADCWILTRSKGVAASAGPGRFASIRLPDVPIFKADHSPVEVVFPETNDRVELRMLEGKRVVAFAGIAHPDYFKETLESLGVEIVFFEAFGDHHQYRGEEVRSLVRRKEILKAHYILTTAKDWVKVDTVRSCDRSLGYLKIEITLGDHEEEFYNLVRERFDGFAKNKNPEMRGSHG